LHHKNHKHSTANHNNPQHHQPVPSGPVPQREKGSFLKRFKEKFQEKPSTKEEVMQLGLNAKREVYRTQIQNAKSARGSKWDNLGGGFGGGSSRSRRSNNGGDFLGGGNSFFNSGPGPSLDFITGNNSRPTRGKQRPSGLEELF
jgi:hypothetical protein